MAQFTRHRNPNNPAPTACDDFAVAIEFAVTRARTTGKRQRVAAPRTDAGYPILGYWRITQYRHQPIRRKAGA